MSNTNAAFGLRPVRTLSGVPMANYLRTCYIPSGYSGTAIYLGDPVIHVGDSNDNEVLGHLPGTLMEVNIASAGATNKITGVITSFEPVTNASTIYRENSTERVGKMIMAHPDVVFEIQDDGGGTLGQDTVGLNAVLVSGTGSTTTGRSGWAMDGGTSTAPSADATYQVTILNVARRIDKDINDSDSPDYTVWEVVCNLPSYAPGVAGVA